MPLKASQRFATTLKSTGTPFKVSSKSDLLIKSKSKRLLPKTIVHGCLWSINHQNSSYKIQYTIEIHFSSLSH